MTNKMPNPLHVQLIQNDASILQYLAHDTSRRTGRTTAQCLEFIAKAIENPYTWVRVVDHTGLYEASRLAWDTCFDMCMRLNLECMVRGKRGSGFFIAFGQPNEGPRYD